MKLVKAEYKCCRYTIKVNKSGRVRVFKTRHCLDPLTSNGLPVNWCPTCMRPYGKAKLLEQITQV